MIKRKKKSRNVDFLLANKHYRRLHLYLYLGSLLLIVFFYFLFLLIPTPYNIMMTGVTSVLIGLFLVFKRDYLVKIISDRMHEKKIMERKRENKQNLKKTINKITPKAKRNINLKIGGKDTFKDKVANLKMKLNPKKKKSKNKQGYIEIDE